VIAGYAPQKARKRLEALARNARSLPRASGVLDRYNRFKMKAV